MKNKKIIIQFVLFISTIVIGSILLWHPFTELLGNTDNIREFVSGFGLLAPLAFILLIILQVLIAPIPGNLVGVAGRYLFGGFLGLIYGMVGLIIGSFLAFYLARKLGRPFVEKFVKKKTLKKFDKLISKRGLFLLFWIYLLPALPDDTICYIAGLTKLKLRSLMVVSSIGRLPGFVVLSIIGAGLASQDYILIVTLFVVMLILALFMFLYRNQLEIAMIKFAEKWSKRKKK